MKILDGNSYVCIKKIDNDNNSIIFAGTICYAKGSRLYGYDNNRVYVPIKHIDNYKEYFTLYKESPYNKEQNELRNQYAGIAMQGMLANSFGEDVMNPENVAKQAIKYANALVQELRKEM